MTIQRRGSNHLSWLQEFRPEVAIRMGTIAGISGNRKFGSNPTISTGTVPETIWNAGGLYNWQADADFQVEVVSSDAADDGDPAGTGAHTILLIGLAGDDWDQVTESVTLNGTTAVPTTRTDWRRLDRAVITAAGSAGTNVGDVTIRIQGGGDTIAQCGADSGQTSLAAFSVAGDRSAAITAVEVGVTESANSSNLQYALFTRDSSVANPVWRRRMDLGTRGAGTTFQRIELDSPIILGPKSDVELRVLSCSSNGVAVVGVFEMTLVETWILNQST